MRGEESKLCILMEFHYRNCLPGDLGPPGAEFLCIFMRRVAKLEGIISPLLGTRF